MARIFISLSGEGRGHASRVLSLIQHLKNHHVSVFAPGLAYDFLKTRAGTNLELIEGLQNRYAPEGHWDYLATLRASRHYFSRLPALVCRLAEKLRADRPDLVITDFEPALPRAAERANIPYLSINHQHFMVVNDLSGLPCSLRAHAFWMGLGVRRMYTRQKRTIVSSFFSPPLKPQYKNVAQVGVLLRPEVVRAQPCENEHLVAYIRRIATPRLLDALKAQKSKVLVYGLGKAPPSHNLVFKAIDPEEFVVDLASARALVCTAGNQIVGESLYLGKPVCALPEANNFEQRINAHFLTEMNAGMAIPCEHVTGHDLQRFLAMKHRFMVGFDRTRINGTPEVLSIIHQELGTKHLAAEPHNPRDPHQPMELDAA